MGVKGLKSLQRKVTKIRDDLGDEVDDAVESGARDTVAEMQRNVAQQNAVWRGNLYRSLRYTKSTIGGGTRFSIVAGVPYAAYVEFGTGKRRDKDAPLDFQFAAPSHTPELTKDIRAWVMTKPVFYRPRTEAVAWGIAKAISEKGTFAHPFMRPAWFRTKPRIETSAGYAARKVIRRS